MIVSKRPLPTPPRWLLALCSCLLPPLGATYAQDRPSGVEESAISAPRTGSWHPSSDRAYATTGDIQVTPSRVSFANGTSVPIEPAFSGATNVFAIEPAANPAMLGGNRLCASPVTFVTLITYNSYALAMHLYDGPHPPPAPTEENVSDLARIGKCASYYYHRPG